MDPILLFFLFGVTAGVLRSELRLPAAVYDFVSTLLLLAIGLKGGVELARQSLPALAPQMLAVIVMGAVLTLLAYPVLRGLGRLARADAASIAAHYGSVSVGTYAVAVAWLGSREIYFEEHMPLLLVLLEIPAIVIGIALARGLAVRTQWRTTGREVFLGKGVMLLIGGLLIGWIAGPAGVESIEPLFFDLFRGILALFLLEVGLLTAGQLGGLRRNGLFLAAFGIVMPLASSVIGIAFGTLLGLSVGGTAILATLAASASYIAAPAAMRISVPEADPTLSLVASLGVTFPFNILLGIPIYYALAAYTHTLLGG